MQRLRHSRPNPALAVAILALVAALAGTAVAADPVANSSALTKKKVKKIVKKQINKLAPGLSVAHADTADSATNAQNADNATNAQNADNATNAQNAVNAQNADEANQADNATTVNNVGVQGVRYRTNVTTNSPQTLVNLGGLTLIANCNGGDLSLVANTSTNNATLSSAAIDTGGDNVDANTLHSDDFDTADNPLDLLAVDDLNQVLHVEYTRPQSLASLSAATSAVLQADDDSPNINCQVTGHAFRNGGGTLFVPLP